MLKNLLLKLVQTRSKLLPNFICCQLFKDLKTMNIFPLVAQKFWLSRWIRNNFSVQCFQFLHNFLILTQMEYLNEQCFPLALLRRQLQHWFNNQMEWRVEEVDWYNLQSWQWHWQSTGLKPVYKWTTATLQSPSQFKQVLLTKVTTDSVWSWIHSIHSNHNGAQPGWVDSIHCPI